MTNESNQGYELTGIAEDELGDILEQIADRDGPTRALHVHGRFVKAFELLAFQPGSGTTRPKLTGEQVRWWPVFKWLVIYDPETSPLLILRVLYGGRELGKIFPEGDDE